MGEAGRHGCEGMGFVSDHRLPAALIATLVAGLLAGAILQLPPVMGVNDASRWNTVWALTHGHGYVIDDAPYETIDKTKRDGHFYSSKPALAPTLVAGAAWIVKATIGLELPDHDIFLTRLLVALVNILPLAALILLYDRLLERLNVSASARMVCLVVAGMGTYLTGYSVTLNNHTVAACGAFFALYCLIGILYEGRRDPLAFVLCGLFTAWTVANEIPAGLFGLMVTGLLLYRRPRETMLFFAPPALLVTVAFFVTTHLSTGSWAPFYFQPEAYRYEGSYWYDRQGMDALNEPKWVYLIHMTIGHHGLLSLTPVLALAFLGFFTKSPWRAINVMGGALTVVMIAVYTVKTRNYGGECQGMRWLIWLIPFWLISLAPFVDRHIGSRWFRWLALALLLISVLSVANAIGGSAETSAGPWTRSWLQSFLGETPLVSY